MIIYRSPEEIERIRESCLLVCKVLTHVASVIRPGITVAKIDIEAYEIFTIYFGRECSIAQAEALVQRKLPQSHIVSLAAGEVLQERAVAGGLQHPEVNLKPVLEDHRGLGRTLQRNFFHHWKVDEAIHHGLWVV